MRCGYSDSHWIGLGESYSLGTSRRLVCHNASTSTEGSRLRGSRDGTERVPNERGGHLPS